MRGLVIGGTQFIGHHALTAGIVQTFGWYREQGLDRREVDFAADDRMLAGRA